MEGAACDDTSVDGMHLPAIESSPVASVAFAEKVVGRIFEGGHARHCVLGDIRSTYGSA